MESLVPVLAVHHMTLMFSNIVWQKFISFDHPNILISLITLTDSDRLAVIPKAGKQRDRFQSEKLLEVLEEL